MALRLLRGESIDALSRELGVAPIRLETWRSKALLGIETAMRERGEPAESVAMGEAMKRIGELSMANELLLARCKAREAHLPLGSRRPGR